jgi:hypothetical protein
VLSIREHAEQLCPEFLSFARILEGAGVADHDEAIARTREEYVQTFWGIHESYVVIFIASREGNDDDVALLSLVVVCFEMVRLEDQ